MNIIKRLTCFLFNHSYELEVINPYIDSNSNHSANYRCRYCGKKITKTFIDRGGSKPWLM